MRHHIILPVMLCFTFKLYALNILQITSVIIEILAYAACISGFANNIDLPCELIPYAAIFP